MEGVENDNKIRVESGTWSPNLEKKEMAEITALKAEIVALKAKKNAKAATIDPIATTTVVIQGVITLAMQRHRQ
jgi:hypothetical protein